MMKKKIIVICVSISSMLGIWKYVRYATEKNSHISKARVVHVYNWAEYLPQDVIQQFQRETGIRVVYDTFDGAEVLEAKMFASRSGYDVVFPSAWPNLGRLVMAGLCLPLDFTQIPNARHLDMRILEKLRSADPNNRFAIPYLWGTTGLAYNQTWVRRCNIDLQHDIENWKILFNAESLKRLSECGPVVLLDSPSDVLPALMIYLGMDAHTRKNDDLNDAVQHMLTLYSHIKAFDSFHAIDRLMRGEIMVAQTWSTYAAVAHVRGKKLETPINIQYVAPRHGALIWADVMVIPADALHVKEAHAFINFILHPLIMQRIMNQYYALGGIHHAKNLLKPSVQRLSSFFPDFDQIDKCFCERVHPPEKERHLNRAWLRIKLGMKPQRNQRHASHHSVERKHHVVEVKEVRV